MNPHYDRGENLVEDAENVVSLCKAGAIMTSLHNIGRSCSLVLATHDN